MKKVKAWSWRLALVLGLVGVVLSHAGPAAAEPLSFPSLPPGGEAYVWGG